MSRSVVRRPTLADVARHAGVSIATASYAINGNGTIAAATRTRVREAAADLGYVPNAAAASLRRGTSQVDLLVLPNAQCGGGWIEAANELTRQDLAGGRTLVMCAFSTAGALVSIVSALRPHTVVVAPEIAWELRELLIAGGAERVHQLVATA